MRLRALLGPGVAAAAMLASTSSAIAAPAYGPADSATVHPGVQTFVEGSQCTANFIFDDGSKVYVGSAAHCAGTGEATDTDGCLAGTRPIGTPVQVTGASRPARLAYSSWSQMQAGGETDPDTCAYNDFALYELDPADVAKTNPSVPTFGGPTGLGADTTTGAKVVSYGNSSLRQGITLLSPKRGFSLGESGGGWTHSVYTLSPGIPGDSGSGFLSADGRAFGVLSTLALAPLPLSNGVSDLQKAVDYMKARTDAFDGVQLAQGTEPFADELLPTSAQRRTAGERRALQLLG